MKYLAKGSPPSGIKLCSRQTELFSGGYKSKVSLPVCSTPGGVFLTLVTPNEFTDGLTVAPVALPLPAHLHLPTVQQLAVLQAALEPVKDPGQHRERDRPEGFADFFLQVIDVSDGLGINPILDVAPEAGIGKRFACHYAMWGAKGN